MPTGRLPGGREVISDSPALPSSGTAIWQATANSVAQQINFVALPRSYIPKDIIKTSREGSATTTTLQLQAIARNYDLFISSIFNRDKLRRRE